MTSYLNVTQTREAYQRLVHFHRTLRTAPGSAMAAFLTALETGSEVEPRYLELVRAMYEAQSSEPSGPCPDAWQNHLLHRMLTDENPFTLAAAGGLVPPETLEAAAYDLRLLQRLFGLSAAACRSLVKAPGLPTWPGTHDLAPQNTNPAAPSLWAMAEKLAAAPDWGAMAGPLAAFYREAGAGLGSAYWYLRWSDGKLQGIAEPQVFDVENLVGLDEAKATVLRNTEQFLTGPANNLLLFGSRGTGKSSMVRGLAARYGTQGLRLVEVARGAIATLPDLFRLLRRSPLRYVLFLDDLSFEEGASDYKVFKSVIEGALEEKPRNVVLYATSNRRHLVPETWSDRNTPDTAEVHGQDALEEKLSLADRFGLTVLFPSPDQEQYLAIVLHMARERGLTMPEAELKEAALRWVLWNNPRSGRSARQFVDDLAGRVGG